MTESPTKNKTVALRPRTLSTKELGTIAKLVKFPLARVSRIAEYRIPNMALQFLLKQYQHQTTKQADVLRNTSEWRGKLAWSISKILQKRCKAVGLPEDATTAAKIIWETSEAGNPFVLEIEQEITVDKLDTIRIMCYSRL